MGSLKWDKPGRDLALFSQVAFAGQKAFLTSQANVKADKYGKGGITYKQPRARRARRARRVREVAGASERASECLGLHAECLRVSRTASDWCAQCRLGVWDWHSALLVCCGTGWDWGLSPRLVFWTGTTATIEPRRLKPPVRHCVWLGFFARMSLRPSKRLTRQASRSSRASRARST